jgi:energy-coupling factor transport system permease protein
MRILQDITLGQYLPADSIIHDLDPRLKCIVLIVLMVVVFFIEDPLKFTLLGLCVLLIIRLSKIPLTYVLKGIAPFVWLFLFASIAHFFFTPGESIAPFPIWKINVTREGVANGVVVTVRILFIILLSSLLTLTTTPLELTTALKRVLSPLERWKVPVGDFAMMMMLTLRFVPILLMEARRIINAQKSRGIDFESGGLVARAKKLVPIFIPLFHLSFKRADELAIAMTCRGYMTGISRTTYRELRFKRVDLYAGIASLLVMPFFFI